MAVLTTVGTVSSNATTNASVVASGRRQERASRGSSEPSAATTPSTTAGAANTPNTSRSSTPDQRHAKSSVPLDGSRSSGKDRAKRA